MDIKYRVIEMVKLNLNRNFFYTRKLKIKKENFTENIQYNLFLFFFSNEV